MGPEPVVILVHGAWHGSWAWADVVERLSAEGVRCVALDLPSKGLDPDALGDLRDDAEAVRAAIAGAAGPALVVAHSYGGLPVSEGAAGAAHIVFVTAFVIEPGESLLGLRGGVPPEWWVSSEDGRTLFPDDPEHVFYADCPPAVAERAAAALVPQRRDVFVQELRAAAWQTVPSTYVICERDNAVPSALQERMSGRAGAVSRLDSGHSPFLSRPGEVTAIIQKALAALA
jgi:pimeloyl-ACP methyl ester carboxylesterase